MVGTVIDVDGMSWVGTVMIKRRRLGWNNCRGLEPTI